MTDQQTETDKRLQVFYIDNDYMYFIIGFGPHLYFKLKLDV